MRRFVFVFSLLILGFGNSFAGTRIHWNGYQQTRFTTDFKSKSGFQLRRAKMWFNGIMTPKLPFYFKVQAIFHWKVKGSLDLQDAFMEYRWRNGWLRAGQMVPHFSLQRSQPDYRIPLTERAAIIDALIPAAETLARDVGLEGAWRPIKTVEIFAGIFNGNGADQKFNEDAHFLFTNRTLWHVIRQKQLSVQVGFSLAYRHTDGLKFNKIFGKNAPIFKGTDFRQGAEFLLKNRCCQIQGEYIRARLNARTAWGYYFLLGWHFVPKHEITFSVERFKDLNAATSDAPWYIAGYQYLFDGEAAKFLTDFRVQQTRGTFNYQATVQFQLFFNDLNG